MQNIKKKKDKIKDNPTNTTLSDEKQLLLNDLDDCNEKVQNKQNKNQYSQSGAQRKNTRRNA